MVREGGCNVIYLDTHVAAWLYNGDVELFGAEASGLLESHNLVVSPAAVYELQWLYEAKKLQVESSRITHFLNSSLGVVVCSMPFDQLVFEAMRVDWTEDLFDRLIVANARLADAPLLTKNEEIRMNFEDAVWG